MKKKALITTLIFIIFLVFVFLLTKNISAETQTSTKSEKKSQAYDASLYRDKTFYRTYNNWLKEGLEVVGLDNPLSFSYEENTLEKKAQARLSLPLVKAGNISRVFSHSPLETVPAGNIRRVFSPCVPSPVYWIKLTFETFSAGKTFSPFDK